MIDFTFTVSATHLYTNRYCNEYYTSKLPPEITMGILVNKWEYSDVY